MTASGRLAVKTATAIRELQREAHWLRGAFEIHWYARHSFGLNDKFCQGCEDLDTAAVAAERAYLEATNV